MLEKMQKSFSSCLSCSQHDDAQFYAHLSPKTASLIHRQFDDRLHWLQGKWVRHRSKQPGIVHRDDKEYDPEQEAISWYEITHKTFECSPVYLWSNFVDGHTLRGVNAIREEQNFSISI